MEDKQITQNTESIEIIMKMINQAKVNVKDSAFHFLLWGWLIMALSLSHFVLAVYTDYEHPYIVWAGTILGAITSFVYGFIKGKDAKTRTYADSVYVWIWIGFLISFTITFVFVMGNATLISSMSLVFAGFATFLSGHVLKYRPLIVGGILFWFFAIACFYLNNQYSLLVTAVAVLVGYLIPGYQLRNKVEDGTL